MSRYGYLRYASGVAVLFGSLSAYSAVSPVAPVNSITLTNESGAAIRNYPLQFGRPFLDGAIADEPQVLVGGTPVATQADVKNRYPDGSVEYAVVALMIPSLPASGSVTLTFQNQTSGNNTPLTQAQMLSLAYMFSAQMILAPTAGGKVQSVDARTMLSSGDYKLWTSGPVAQTIILADDSPARKYDIGFGDGYHPFRPRYYATFWPATHQVNVRYVGENGNATELEGLAYSLTLTGGNAKLYSKANLTDWAMSNWTKSFWLGGTPAVQVNIDNNLAYLASTRFVPNYDPSITVSPGALTYEYAGYYTNVAHDLYDGNWDGGAWTNGMSTTGARQDIGPNPTWNVYWLYTGDWRMRQLALGMADLAAAWPANLREGDPSKRLNRADTAPAAPAIGSGYGLPVSITDRKTLGASNGGEADFLYYSGGQGAPASDQVKVVGPLNVSQPWEFDASHEPSPFYIPYVLTGDPFYLLELENWAAYDATESIGQDTSGSQGRGPTGAEGGEDDQLRGVGWTIRSRAEAAFAVPDCVSSAGPGPGMSVNGGTVAAVGSCDGNPGDGDPFKSYLTILTNDDIARWEGVLGVADPVLDTSPEYLWAQQTGDPESSTEFGNPPPAPGLGGLTADIAGGIGSFSYVQQGIWTDANVSSLTAVWMQWYTQYSLGRAKELGFAAGPLALATGNFLTGMINNSGYPELIASYELPVSTGNTMLKTWPAVIAEMAPAYLTSTDPNSFPSSSGQAPLPVMFKGQLYSQGYDIYASAAMATAVDDGVAGAAQAEAWINANIYQPLYPSLAGDPSWAIVPRTDNNTLPAQLTTPQ